MIWKTTQKLGCAVNAGCAHGPVLVCHYYPAGMCRCGSIVWQGGGGLIKVVNDFCEALTIMLSGSSGTDTLKQLLLSYMPGWRHGSELIYSLLNQEAPVAICCAHTPCQHSCLHLLTH